MTASLDAAISAYTRFFETMTDASVEGFRELAAPGVRYRDPFADAKGIDAVIAYMHKWFKDMDGLRFELGDHAQVGNVVMSHWIMHFRLKKLPRNQWKVEGMSRITVDDNQKVIDQVDYWDSAPLLEAVPLLGRVVAFLKRAASA